MCIYTMYVYMYMYMYIYIYIHVHVMYMYSYLHNDLKIAVIGPKVDLTYEYEVQ